MTTPRIPFRSRVRFFCCWLQIILLFPFRLVRNFAHLYTIELQKAEIEVLTSGYAARGRVIDELRDSLDLVRRLHTQSLQEIRETREAWGQDAKQKAGAIEVLERKLAETAEELRKALSTIQVQDLELKLLAGVNQRNFERVQAESAMACRRIAAAKHSGEAELIAAADGG